MHDIIKARIGEDRALIVSPTIREDLPPAAREGLARRRIVNAGGTCPCGALAAWPNRASRRRAARMGRPLAVTVEHEAGCPATNEALAEAMRSTR